MERVSLRSLSRASPSRTRERGKRYVPCRRMRLHGQGETAKVDGHTIARVSGHDDPRNSGCLAAVSWGAAYPAFHLFLLPLSRHNELTWRGRTVRPLDYLPTRAARRRRTVASSSEVTEAPGLLIRSRSVSRRAHRSPACPASEWGWRDAAALRSAARGALVRDATALRVISPSPLTMALTRSGFVFCSLASSYRVRGEVQRPLRRASSSSGGNVSNARW